VLIKALGIIIAGNVGRTAEYNNSNLRLSSLLFSTRRKCIRRVFNFTRLDVFHKLICIISFSYKKKTIFGFAKLDTILSYNLFLLNVSDILICRSMGQEEDEETKRLFLRNVHKMKV
jgi:hypothetical protein